MRYLNCPECRLCDGGALGYAGIAPLPSKQVKG